MTMTEPIRIAISGAGGRIGYSLVFRIANGGLFGHEQPVALSLLELPDAMPRLEACAMELKDCAFPLLADLRIGSDPLRIFKGADWAILAGGKPFRPEVRFRFDLLRDNAPIMLDHARAINLVAPTARVLVVVNPSNTNCMIAKSQAPNVPADHWFALNHFLRMRATAALAEKVGVPVNQITRLTIWGNNSETAYIDLPNTRIGNKPALDVISDPNWVRNVFEPHRRQSRPRDHEARRRHACRLDRSRDHHHDSRHHHSHSLRTLVRRRGRLRRQLRRSTRPGLRLPLAHGRWQDMVDRPGALPRHARSRTHRPERRRTGA